jgi:hypothetical protein
MIHKEDLVTVTSELTLTRILPWTPTNPSLHPNHNPNPDITPNSYWLSRTILIAVGYGSFLRNSYVTSRGAGLGTGIGTFRGMGKGQG